MAWTVKPNYYRASRLIQANQAWRKKVMVIFVLLLSVSSSICYSSFPDLLIVLFTMVDFLLPLIVQNVGSFDVAAIFRLLRMFRAIRALRALRVLRTIRWESSGFLDGICLALFWSVKELLFFALWCNDSSLKYLRYQELVLHLELRTKLHGTRMLVSNPSYTSRATNSNNNKIRPSLSILPFSLTLHCFWEFIVSLKLISKESALHHSQNSNNNAQLFFSFFIWWQKSGLFLSRFLKNLQVIMTTILKSFRALSTIVMLQGLFLCILWSLLGITKL